jgi:hypothetical protein
VLHRLLSLGTNVPHIGHPAWSLEPIEWEHEPRDAQIIEQALQPAACYRNPPPKACRACLASATSEEHAVLVHPIRPTRVETVGHRAGQHAERFQLAVRSSNGPRYSGACASGYGLARVPSTTKQEKSVFTTYLLPEEQLADLESRITQEGCRIFSVPLTYCNTVNTCAERC